MSQLIKKQFPSITSIDVGSDGNTSFLRAARNGQLEKVLEHLESNIDINTSNANGLNALHLASKDGHVEIVEELLKRGAVIDAATKKGNTALHIASLAGQEEVVKLLVNHGASVNVQSQNGFTPLYMAAQENHDNVVKYLLANGANQSLSTEDGFTPLAVAMQQGHDKVVTVLLENDTRGKVRLPALHIAAKKDDVKAAKLLLENEHNPDVTSKSGFTPLHIASHYGNQAIANLLVQKGADVNYSAKHNITPLHVAAKWGKTNMVTVLLEQGANIESKTRDGLTPLHCAARSGHEQVVDMLLEKGAPISSKTKNGLAPLHMAAQGDHVDAARILLYHRAPVDEVTVDYLTALHVAAHCGHVRVAKLLLDRQADANARALNGFTPLHIACKKNRIKVVELLLKHGASIGATTESGLTPLHVASFMGCMNIVIYLLQHDANPDVPTVRGETPLHLAARANQTDIIRILLRNGAQVDARAREQQTPLHIASRLGNVDIVMLLLQHGAKVDNTTKDMYTALHIAAKEGQDEVAAALIDNGASLNATTKKGFTPLHLAAKYGHLKVAKLLLQKEAPVDAQGKNGVTPLHVASHYDHQNVALLLLEKGASPYATAKNGHTPLHIAAKKNQMDIANTLLEYGAKPNAESKAGFTPLHLSAQEGHCDMSDLLIEHKADPNHNAKNGLTPLHLCAQEDKVPVAEILVKNGGEVDAATKNGYTPLHIASHYGQINMVRFLLSHGANVKATTSLGYTPLHQAAQQGHTNIVNTLLENSAQPNATTTSGQTPLHIAEKLGYITVIDTLKVVTNPSTPTTSPVSNDEKYRVVAPEAMHETFMSDSEEEGGEDTVLGDQTYRYLTADEMKSLGDDSLPIDVTRDERIDSNKMVASTENMLPPRHIEDNISPEHVQPNYVEYIKKYTPDNVDIDRHPISIGKLHWKNFLVSFLVDARGGAMRGCRHSGVRVIVPSRCAPSPTRITCRYVRPQRTPHPPPLMEGEALASRVLELGPVGAKFLGPVIIEVPHFAALRGKEREIVILRSDNGESWKEHTVEATEEVLNDVLHDSFEAEDLNQLEDVSSGRITRIVTQDFPQYFAVVSRIRQEVHAIGPEGGMVSSTVVPQVQAVFPQGALTKKIKVGLQAQPIDPEISAKLLGHGVAVSPVVTIEPRRRKFHKPIMLSMPAPRAHSQGMINQYSGSAPTLRLLCSITGGTTKAHWEDVTGSTPLNFVNDCVTFTTTVSARFWLMDCRNVDDATKMATALYSEAIHVPFMAKFVVFAKRVDPLEARLRVFCMTDDKEDKTLEHQEHFTEVAKSRDVEVLEGKPQYIEFAGNLVPITKSGEQLQFSFRAFRENRLPFSVRVKDQHAEAVSRCLFMREAKLPKGEPPQQPICILNIVLPDDIVVDTISLTDTDSVKKIENFDYYRPDPRLADMSNLLGEDWVPLATHLGLTTSEINVIKSEYPDSVAKQAQSMLRMWLSQSGNKAQTNTLESALKRIGREDIIPQCLNVDYTSHGIKEIGKQRLIKAELEQRFEKDIMKDAQNVDSLKKDVNDKYSAEEKVVEEASDEEDFNKTVSERRHQIEEQLSVDRTVPASSQRVEIVQEISSIKRQSLVENKRAEVEHKATGEVVDELKTTEPSNELTISPSRDNVLVDGDRRDSALLEGVTQRFEQKAITKITSVEDPKSPKLSKTPPPSPADFISKERAAEIQDWDASKKPAIQEDTSTVQDAKQQGLSTTTERLVASNEETLLDKPLGHQLTGLSVIDDYLSTDLRTLFEQTNAFIQSESQPEPFDPLAEKYTRKEPISTKKIDDKNNMNEKKKAKKGFFGTIKTFVERSLESDSESEKSPKKSKKPKKEKKKQSKEEESKTDQGLPPRKPKLPTPPLAPSDLDSIPYVEVSASDLPPPYNPPDVPTEHVQIPVTDLDADLELEQVQEVKEKFVSVEVSKKSPKDQDKVIKKIDEVKGKDKEKKKVKSKTTVTTTEEVTKSIEPLVVEGEAFSIIVDPTKKESPKKSKETFTINIDESIDKIEKEIMEKSPILSEEKIVKPFVDFDADIPVLLSPTREHVYEDVETTPTSVITQIDVSTTFTSPVEKIQYDDETIKTIIEKHDKELSKESDINVDVADVDAEHKKKGERKTSFFGLFKKKDVKKEEEPIEQNEEIIEKPALSESVLKDMKDTDNFLSFEVENYQDAREPEFSLTEIVDTTSKPETKETKTQSEGFFGLFKKQKKDEKELKPEPVEPTKFKKDDKKFEQSKAVAFSEEILKNMLDSKRFLESEMRNYEDAPRSAVRETTEITKVTEELPEKSFEKVTEVKTEASPKKTIGEEKEALQKPGVLTSLFKILKRDESGSEESKDVLSEQVLHDMKQTEEFLVGEVANYHDVKLSPQHSKTGEVIEKIDDAIQTKSLEAGDAVKVKDTKLPEAPGKSIEAKTASPKKTTREEKEASPKPGVLTSLFKKLRRDESGSQEAKETLSEQVVQEMKQTEEFLVGEITNYHDIKLSPEDKHEITISKVQSYDAPHSKALETKEIIRGGEVILEESLEKSVERKIETLPKETVRQEKEASPKPGVLSGLFKKLRKDEPGSQETKDTLSEQVLQEMKHTEEFLVGEVINYHDVKVSPKATESVETVEPLLTEQIKVEDSAVLEAGKTDEAKESQKPFSGLFGIFKKSKKDEEEVEESKAALSNLALQNIKDTNQFLLSETENYHDVKPDKFDVIEQEKVEVTSGDESSPKTARGLFRIFKKQKKEEPVVSKGDISKEALEQITGTESFLICEVDNYHDVKPESFEQIIEEVTAPAVVEGAVESSPKSSRGLFGVFKKSKKESEAFKEKPSLSEEVQRDITDSQAFLSTEVENYQDEKPALASEENALSTTKSSGGLFGIFKKSKKSSDDADESEAAIRNIEATNQFLADEVENYEDQKPEKFVSIPEKPDLIEESVEASPKPSRGLFGIFKKPKKEDDQSTKSKMRSEEAAKEIASTSTFLQEEIANYHDVKVKVNIVTVVEETKETILMPVTAVQSISQDQKDDVQDGVRSTEEVLRGEKLDTTEIAEADVKEQPEVKTGFLNKYKKTKKSVTVIEPAISKQQVEEDMESTRKFILTELENYDETKNVPKDKKEEKTVTFAPTRSTMVSEGQLARPETVQVVELMPKDTLDEVKEPESETFKGSLEEKQADEEHEAKPTKKDKQSKDKKGFFNIFGRKTKSQETSLDEPRGRSEEVIESSSKKQKRRKSSSPFKFFDKMKKSEDDSKSVEADSTIPSKVEEADGEDQKDDFLAVEFKEPTTNLSDEVLSSLDQKLEALKNKYAPETQKQMNDCRDFLFIEVDNYEDGKPVVTTDIDTDLSNNVSKTVDSIIHKATKVVQQVSEQKSAEAATKLAAQRTDVTVIIKDATAAAETVTDAIAENIDKGVDTTLVDLSDLGDKFGENIKETKTQLETTSSQILSEIQPVKQIQAVTEETTHTLTTLKDGMSVKTEKKVEEIKESLPDKKHAAAESIKNICDLKDSTKRAIASTHEMMKTVKTEIITANGKEAKDRKFDAPQEDSRKESSHQDTISPLKQHLPEVGKLAEKTLDRISVETEKSTKELEESVQIKADTLIPKEVDLLFGAPHDIPTFPTAAATKKVPQQIDQISGKIGETAKITLDGIEDVTRGKEQKEINFDVIPFEEEPRKECTSKVEDIINKAGSITASEVMKSTTKIPDNLIDSAERKFEEFGKTSSERIENLEARGSDFIAPVHDQFAESIDDILKAATRSVEQKSQHIPKSIQQTEKGITTLADNLSNVLSQKVDDLSDAKVQNLEKAAKSKENIVDDIRHLKENIEDVSKDRMDDVAKLPQGISDECKITSETAKHDIKTSVSDTKQAFEDKIQKGAEKMTAGIRSEFQDAHETVGAAAQAVPNVQVLGETITQGSQKFKEEVASIFSEIKKEQDYVQQMLDDKVQSLSSSFDDLVDAISREQEAFASYVTSPTMARRAESHRFPRGERPTVREIKTPQLESDSDDELYFVTEPEEIKHETHDRKPLFHLESEEDDTMLESGKSKGRRDSVKSNVLETLTDNNLENLLSDLEVQLVKDLEESVTEGQETVESKVFKAEIELESIQKDSQADVKQIEEKLRDLDKALDSLEQASDSKLEKKLHRVERKFERMASEVMEKDDVDTSPTEVERRHENDFQKLVSQLSTEEVSDFQKEYSHLWDETTFSKSDDWDSKTPDSQVDVQELPQGEESSFAEAGEHSESGSKVGKEQQASGGQQTAQSSSQQKSVADQHQLSEEMKLLMQELEKESKQ